MKLIWKLNIAIVVMLFPFIYCKSFSQQYLQEESKKYKTSSVQVQEQILENMYKKKDQVPEKLKKDYLMFFMDHPSSSSFQILTLLYEDPKFSNYRKLIFNYFLDHLEKPFVFQFVEKAILQNPDLYDLKTKEKLIQKESKESAEIILNLIYLKKEKLTPDIIYLFKKTQLIESLPVLIQSIENHRFVEESFSAIASIPTEEAQDFLVSIASDPEHPYQNIALGYIHRLNNKELAISIFESILENSKDNKSLLITLNGLKSLVPYLKESQTEKLIIQLKNLYKSDQENFKKPIEELSTLLQKPIIDTDHKRNLSFSITTKSQKRNQKQTPLLSKKSKKTRKNQKSYPQKIKRQNNKQFYESKEYAHYIKQILENLLLDESKETITNIHNALLTYADSQSSKAKFIIRAYQTYYQITDEKKIRTLLKKGLLLKQSLYAILSFIESQYPRKDLQIYALQEIFAIKRKHAKILIESKGQFQ